MNQKPTLALLEALEPRLAPAGIIAVSTAGGVLSLTGDAGGGDNDIFITETTPGIWKIDSRNGDTFRLNGAATAESSIQILAQNGIKAQLGAGNDTLELDGLVIAGPVTLVDPAGNDTFKLTNSTVNGAVKIDTGSGIDRVDFNGNRLNSLLSIKTGADSDTVNLGSEGSFRDISIDLGTGSNTYNTNVNNFQVYGNFTLLAAGGASDFQEITLGAGNGLITGNVKITVKAGGTDMDFGIENGDHLRVNGSFTVQTGAGQDLLRFNHSTTIGGLLSFKAGEGSNSLIANEVTALTIGGGLTYSGGKSGDFIAFGGVAVTIGGNVNLSMGNGEFNSFSLSLNESLLIGGNVVYKGGTGVDNFRIFTDSGSARILGNASFTGGNGENSFEFSAVTGSIGAVTYTGGTGGDNLRLGDLFNDTSLLLSVLGPVNAKFATGPTSFSLADAVVYGHVTTLSATGVEGGEFWEIKDSKVIGKVSHLSSGVGTTVLDIQDSTFLSTLDLNTGGGNDTLRFDTRLDSSLFNIFQGAVKILLGDGDDTLTLGNANPDAFVANLFDSTFSLDGGKGDDTAFVKNTFGNTYAAFDPVILPTVENLP